MFGEEAVRKVLAEGCKWCKGTGVYYVQSGPDDVDAEECECQTIQGGVQWTEVRPHGSASVLLETKINNGTRTKN